jgi:hypothetical protein
MNLQIDTRTSGVGESNAPAVIVSWEHSAPWDGTSAIFSFSYARIVLTATVNTPHLARELAQHLQGAADEFVRFAERAEARP